MSNYKELMSHALRAFPTLYREPLDVVVEMLGSGGNYEWDERGQLRATYGLQRDGGVMDFSDLNEGQERLDREKAEGVEFLKSLTATRQLALTAERQRRCLLDQNMETVLDGKATDSYFRREYEYGSSAREIVQAKSKIGTDTRFLYFPDNIDPQWGAVVSDFHDWLSLRMNHEFGVSISGTTTHWPEHAQLLAKKIQLSRERLHPLLHGGEEYASYIERSNALASRLIDELLEEEREVRPSARRSGP